MNGISEYLKQIQKHFATGEATEHTYRPALKSLIESLGKQVTAINEPKRVACGAPDFIVTREQTPLGYIEAKDIGKNLDEEERSEQMARYLEGLSNLILTDYLEFRWYEDGKFVDSARLARLGVGGKLREEPDGTEKFTQLVSNFLSSAIPTIGGPKELAGRMAALARLIRDVILRALQDEDKGGTLHAQMEGFRKVLLHDLDSSRFADMYAQTISYGLFAARCSYSGGTGVPPVNNHGHNAHATTFTRKVAAYDIPKTNPFLRKMFNYIAGPDLDERVTWAVDHLAELLRQADMYAILKNFGKRTRREDPVVHFYETFLAAYDPKMRQARGVYYTPEPVVSYIVRSVDYILKKDFGLKDGLADTAMIPVYRTVKDKNGETRRKKVGECHKVLILDPACGTGTFLYSVIDHIYQHTVNKGQKGAWSGYVSKHLLPRLFGFELLMAPYAVAHMKLSLQLAETGYDFKSGERLRIYLTNALEEPHEFAGLDLFASTIAEEANAASEVKSEAPVMVILGNPPYSRSSLNQGVWIEALMEEYKTTVRQRETQIQALSDDYAKFIRFAQWRITQTGYGVVGFICNNGFLDGPLFRDMRASLLSSFDGIHILNLHGDSRKREKAPDSAHDKNVFDIQQGVTILLAARCASPAKCRAIQYADLWGTRHQKYSFLNRSCASDTKWVSASPGPPHLLFVPVSADVAHEADQMFHLHDVFGTGHRALDNHRCYGAGFVTQQDSFAISHDELGLRRNIEDFLNPGPSEQTLRSKYRLCTTNQWDFERARRELHAINLQDLTRRCLYRPFDWRYTVFDRNVCTILRKRIMVQFDSANTALLTTRRITRLPFNNVFVANTCPEYKVASHDRNTMVFPLYFYSAASAEQLLGSAEQATRPPARRPNLSPEFVAELQKRLGWRFIPDGKGDLKNTFGPEDIFDYMYAVFHSPTYRTRYAEFLKIDFPRLPLTSSRDLFPALCKLGEELVALHLTDKHAPTRTKYPVEGDNRVERVRYTEPGEGAPTGRVWINNDQYFENVPPEIWQFHIGGYQVCQKWLKDRKGRVLTYDDLTHYQHIVSALGETIRLMAEIDKVIEQHGGWPIH